MRDCWFWLVTRYKETNCRRMLRIALPRQKLPRWLVSNLRTSNWRPGWRNNLLRAETLPLAVSRIETCALLFLYSSRPHYGVDSIWFIVRFHLFWLHFVCAQTSWSYPRQFYFSRHCCYGSFMRRGSRSLYCYFRSKATAYICDQMCWRCLGLQYMFHFKRSVWNCVEAIQRHCHRTMWGKRLND